MTAEIIPIRPAMDDLITMALSTCPSPQTRRMYTAQLRKFIQGGYSLSREGLAAFLQAQRDAGRGQATVGSCASAVRKLADEAHVRGLLSDAEHYGLMQLKVGTWRRTRKGMWLTLEQVQKLLSLPDRVTYWGKRDACLLACMVGCGFRREEMSDLRWSHYQERDGRMCFVDFMGKGRKLRTVPVPTWAQKDIDAWQGEVLHGRERPPTHAKAHDWTYLMGGIEPNRLYRIVCKYGKRAGVKLAPHDLRRTLAKLMRAASAPLEQIQYTLGHESIETTALYLGTDLKLAKGLAAVDAIPMEVE